MEFDWLLVLGFLWFMFNLLGRKRDAPPRPDSRPPEPGRPPAPIVFRPAGTVASGDATQREGSRLEQFLRQMEQAANQPAGPLGRPAGAPLPGAEEVEQRESLEEDPAVVSLETEVLRPARRLVDHDDEAAAVAARRLASARKRDGELTRADHHLFDSRIRQEPADHTAVRRYSAQQMRDAFVWREILGPPVSERPG
nr:hypothetical protein [Gemmatimonadales bacterium]